MSRKTLILAAVIVALHLFEAATLGTTTSGSLLANLLEILACGFAAVMAFGASRRGHGLSRPPVGNHLKLYIRRRLKQFERVFVNVSHQEHAAAASA